MPAGVPPSLRSTCCLAASAAPASSPVARTGSAPTARSARCCERQRSTFDSRTLKALVVAGSNCSARKRVLEPKEVGPEKTGCSRSDLAGECRRAPIPDVGWFLGRLSVAPRNLSFGGGGARSWATDSATRSGQRLLPLAAIGRCRPNAALGPPWLTVGCAVVTAGSRRPAYSRCLAASSRVLAASVGLRGGSTMRYNVGAR